MKNNIIKYFCIGLISLSISSCNSFLDEKPYSELTNENWGSGGKDEATKYETAEQMEQLLYGAYKDFSTEFWQLDWFIMNDAQSDNAYSGENEIPTTEIDQLTLTSTNLNAKRDWGYLYNHISKSNTIIEWIGTIKDPVLTEKRRAEIDGDAHFMRALAYFNLVRIYGDVPLLTEYIPEITNDNIEELYPLIYPERVATEEVYTQIISDLEYAETSVMDYSDDKFKISKAFVRLILAQVYATKDGFAGTDWQKVKGYLTPVVGDTRYGMMPAFDDLFAIDKDDIKPGELPSLDLKNENSKESIFEVDCKSWTTIGNWGAQMFYGVDWKKFNTPSIDLYRAFDSEGDVIRRDASIMFGDVTGKWTDKYWPSNKYPYCYKMRAQEAANLLFFRLPEAILLLAEAENELGNTAEAKRLLNQIRTRVQLTNTTANTKDEVRLAIEKEYRLEFAFEGKRWMDLKRRGRFIDVMHRAVDHQNEYAKGMTEDLLLWPIPQSELDLNENLTQNKGY